MPAGRPDNLLAVTLGGGLLAAIAGYINAVTLLGPASITASHVTGTTTRLAIAEVADGIAVGLALASLLGFIVGAAISGGVLDSTQLRLGRRYGVLLLIEALLLAAAASLLTGGERGGVVLASLAAGLQNALATQYSRAIVRTTHVTGIATDLGIALGKLVARRHVELWRVALYATLFAGFGGGGVAGGVAWLHWHSAALFAPALTLLLLGGTYTALRMLGRFPGAAQR